MLTKTVNIMQPSNAIVGHFLALISIILGTTYFITWDTVEHVIRLLIGGGSIGTAVMAIRNYYYKTKAVKKALKEDKKIKEEDVSEE